MTITRAVNMLTITERVIRKFYGPLDIIVEIHSEENYNTDSYVSDSADGRVLIVSVSNKTLYTNMALVVLVAVHKYFVEKGSVISDKQLIDDYSKRLDAMVSTYSRHKAKILEGGNPYGN